LNNKQVRFAFRQNGSGTRIWSDFQMRNIGLLQEHFSKDSIEFDTHTDVAQAIAQGHMDVGVGIESAASVFGLDFIPLKTESYDLIIPSDIWAKNEIQMLMDMLDSPEFHKRIDSQVGYDASNTGAVLWVD
jgi:putative molybdopterin biosynthesis protein